MWTSFSMAVPAVRVGGLAGSAFVLLKKVFRFRHTSFDTVV